jgi:hypothetical protein
MGKTTPNQTVAEAEALFPQKRHESVRDSPTQSGLDEAAGDHESHYEQPDDVVTKPAHGLTDG